MKTKELIAAFEAVLFASGEPVSINRFTEAFEVDIDDVIKVMEFLSQKLSEENSGLELLKLDNMYQICSKKKYAEYIKKVFDMKRRTPLSQAALEVLAVVAYNQPVTRAFIEQVRGVDCSGVLSSLIDKELIEERGRLELPGKPLLYGTTKNFLRCFSVSELSELPPLPRDDNGTAVPDVGEQLTVSDLDTEE